MSGAMYTLRAIQRMQSVTNKVAAPTPTVLEHTSRQACQLLVCLRLTGWNNSGARLWCDASRRWRAAPDAVLRAGIFLSMERLLRVVKVMAAARPSTTHMTSRTRRESFIAWTLLGLPPPGVSRSRPCSTTAARRAEH